MSEVKHTPGPWSYVNNSWQYTTIYDSCGCPIATLDLEDRGVTEENQNEMEIEQEKFARLIAAAPDLLEALQVLLEASDWDPTEPMTKEAIIKIAMAQGRAQVAIGLATNP